MAKQDKSSTPKKPNVFKQLASVYRMTAKSDPKAVWFALLALAIGVGVGILLAVLMSGGNGFTAGVWIFTGSLAGVLAAMVIMSRRAERVAYGQIEGQPGAVGAVLAQVLKRGWSGSEHPVAVNAKTRDLVYRAIGPGGVVLIGEGSRNRIQGLLEDEKRKVARAVPGAPVVFLYVCGDENSTPLHKLGSSLYRLKKAMNRREVSAVAKRLSALGTKLPIPKGIDPNRMRASHR
jgi:hypothetical protein